MLLVHRLKRATRRMHWLFHFVEFSVEQTPFTRSASAWSRLFRCWGCLAIGPFGFIDWLESSEELKRVRLKYTALVEPRTVGHRSNPRALGRTPGRSFFGGGCPSRISRLKTRGYRHCARALDHVANVIVNATQVFADDFCGGVLADSFF